MPALAWRFTHNGAATCPPDHGAPEGHLEIEGAVAEDTSLMTLTHPLLALDRTTLTLVPRTQAATLAAKTAEPLAPLRHHLTAL